MLHAQRLHQTASYLGVRHGVRQPPACGAVTCHHLVMILARSLPLQPIRIIRHAWLQVSVIATILEDEENCKAFSKAKEQQTINNSATRIGHGAPIGQIEAHAYRQDPLIGSSCVPNKEQCLQKWSKSPALIIVQNLQLTKSHAEDP